MRRVYFIKPIGMDGPIKIGCSYMPDRRRKTLETWSPFPLEIVAEIEGDIILERRFHAKFAEHHTRQEWFNPTLALAATIELIAMGKFDVDTLPPPQKLPSRAARAGVSRKWSAERKEQNRIYREIRKAEKLSGLVHDRKIPVEKFIADPLKYGITAEERHRRWTLQMAETSHERAIALARKAEANLQEARIAA